MSLSKGIVNAAMWSVYDQHDRNIGKTVTALVRYGVSESTVRQSFYKVYIGGKLARVLTEKFQVDPALMSKTVSLEVVVK